jgi:hypothetical protein
MGFGGRHYAGVGAGVKPDVSLVSLVSQAGQVGDESRRLGRARRWGSCASRLLSAPDDTASNLDR